MEHHDSFFRSDTGDVAHVWAVLREVVRVARVGDLMDSGATVWIDRANDRGGRALVAVAVAAVLGES